MNCPRCEAEIKPAFYCTKCGHVPERGENEEVKQQYKPMWPYDMFDA